MQNSEMHWSAKFCSWNGPVVKSPQMWQTSNARMGVVGTSTPHDLSQPNGDASVVPQHAWHLSMSPNQAQVKSFAHQDQSSVFLSTYAYYDILQSA